MIQTLAFSSHESLRHRATRFGEGRESLRRRHAKQIDILLKKLPLPVVPAGQTIAVIDGYQLFFGKQPWTLYLVLLRPINTTTAVVTEPLLLKGPETVHGWETAFAMLPDVVCANIRAIVSDGLPGIESYVHKHSWIFQRCHFHLLKMLHSLVGRRWHVVSSKNQRHDIYQKILIMLSSDDEEEVKFLFSYVNAFVQSQSCPRWFGLRVRGFLKQLNAFRSYHKYPHLNLPNTTNAAESVCGRIADMVHQTRSFRNPQSFERWVKVYIRLMQPIQCNGKIINRDIVS